MQKIFSHRLFPFFSSARFLCSVFIVVFVCLFVLKFIFVDIFLGRHPRSRSQVKLLPKPQYVKSSVIKIQKFNSKGL